MKRFLGRLERLGQGMLILAAVGWTLAACQRAETVRQPTKGEVYVYVASPLSGFQANGGQTVLGGVNLMAAELNRQGGLLGYKVVVVPSDDESDSEVAVTVAERVKSEIASGKRVLGVIGHYNSGQTLAAMEIYKDLPLIVITPTSSELSITQRGYDNIFRVNANDAVQADVVTRFLTERLNARRIVIVHNDTEYGLGLRDEMIRALNEQGAEAVEILQVSEGQESFAREISLIKEASADAVFYAGYEIEAPYLRYEMVQNGIEEPLLASDGAFLSATIDEAAGTAEGMYVSGFAPSPAQAVGEEWIQRYQEVEYRNPDTYSINGYAALQVLAEGVEKADSLSPREVSEAIRTLTVETPIGELAYQPNGDLVNATIFIFQVREDAFQQVYP